MTAISHLVERVLFISLVNPTRQCVISFVFRSERSFKVYDGNDREIDLAASRTGGQELYSFIKEVGESEGREREIERERGRER